MIILIFVLFSNVFPTATISVSNTGGGDTPSCKTGPTSCKTIAFAAAESEQKLILEVDPGTYTETVGVKVANDLNIIGSGAEQTTLTKPNSLWNSFVLFSLGNGANLLIEKLTFYLSNHNSSTNFVRCNDQSKVSLVFSHCHITMHPELTSIYGISFNMTNNNASFSFENCLVYNIITDGSPYPIIYAASTHSYRASDSSFINIHNKFEPLSDVGPLGLPCNALFFVHDNITSITLVRSTFVMISSSIYNYGGAAIYAHNILEGGSQVESCMFWNMTSRSGSAVHVGAHHSSVFVNNAMRVTDSSFIRCIGSGALYIGNYTEWSIRNCRFTECFCPATYYYSGGALFVIKAKVSLEECTFVKNSAVFRAAIAEVVESAIEFTDCVFFESFRTNLGTNDSIDLHCDVKSTVVFNNVYSTWQTFSESFNYLHRYDYSKDLMKTWPKAILKNAYSSLTCSSFNADNPTENDTCPWPCSADIFTPGSSGTPVCVKPGMCTEGFIDVGGKCVPRCSYWLGPDSPPDDLNLKYCRLDASRPGPMMYVARDTADMKCSDDLLHTGAEFEEDGNVRCTLKPVCSDRIPDDSYPAPCAKDCYPGNGNCDSVCAKPEHYQEGTHSGYCELKACVNRTVLDGSCGSGCVINTVLPGEPECVDETTPPDPTDPTLLPCHSRSKSTLNPLQPCGPPDSNSEGCLWDVTADAAAAAEECVAVEDLNEDAWGWNTTTCWRKSICTNWMPNSDLPEPCGFNDFCFYLATPLHALCTTSCPDNGHYNGASSNGRCVLKGCEDRSPIESETNWPCGYKGPGWTGDECFADGSDCTKLCYDAYLDENKTAETHKCTYLPCSAREAVGLDGGNVVVGEAGGQCGTDMECAYFAESAAYTALTGADTSECLATCPLNYEIKTKRVGNTPSGAIQGYYCAPIGCSSRTSFCSLPGDNTNCYTSITDGTAACVTSCTPNVVDDDGHTCIAPCTSRTPVLVPVVGQDPVLGCKSHDGCYFFDGSTTAGWTSYPACGSTCPPGYDQQSVSAEDGSIISLICKAKDCQPTSRIPLTESDCSLPGDMSICFLVPNSSANYCNSSCPSGFDGEIHYTDDNSRVVGHVCKEVVVSRSSQVSNNRWLFLIIPAVVLVVLLLILLFVLLRKRKPVEGKEEENGNEAGPHDSVVETSNTPQDEEPRPRSHSDGSDMESRPRSSHSPSQSRSSHSSPRSRSSHSPSRSRSNRSTSFGSVGRSVDDVQSEIHVQMALDADHIFDGNNSVEPFSGSDIDAGKV